MANARKYGYVKPVKRNVNPIRWVPKPQKQKRKGERRMRNDFPNIPLEEFTIKIDPPKPKQKERKKHA